jgi:hypothetical protein
MEGTMKKILIISVSLKCACLAHSEGFHKFGYIDPYELLKNMPDTSLNPDSYYGQMDALGLDMVLSVADSISTYNEYGIQIIGQDYLRILTSTGYQDLSYLVHTAINIHAEVENTFTQEGYYWNQIGGTVILEEDIPIGLLFRPGVDSPDTILTAEGPKFCSRSGPDRLTAFIRVMRFSDNSDSDTLCSIRFANGSHFDTLHITGSDFQGISNSWVTVEKDSIYTAHGWAPIHFDIYWYGADSLALDRIDLIGNDGGLLEFTVSEDSIDAAFSDYYSVINTSNHGRFYPSDEPKACQFWACNLYDDHASSISPNHKSTAAMYHDMSLYARDVDPLEVMTFYYPISVEYDSATTGNPNSSIQGAYNNYVSGLRSYVDSSIVETGTPYWVIVQAGCGNSLIDENLPPCDDNLIRGKRNPTYNEEKALIYLPVIYGARGIGYFTYATIYFDTSTYSPPNIDIRLPQSMALAEEEPDEGCENIRFSGLLEWNPLMRRYEPTYRWYAAQEAHAFIDSIWETLENLTWQDAGDWTDINSLTSSIIDSIYSTTFPADSTYIECGTFSSGGNEYYHMFVNRRTLSSESQDVMLEIDNLFSTMEFFDVYSGQADTVFDSSGHIHYELSFTPAECKLLRIKEIKWQGTLTSTITWPEYSTISITGDLAIDTNKTLTIEANTNILIPTCADSTCSGVDTTKTELIVKGRLVLAGSAGDTVKLMPPGDSIGWYGIRTTTTGKVIAECVEIARAYCAFDITSDSTDTLISCTVADCEMYGMRFSANSSYIHDCTISNIPKGYGQSGTGTGYGIYSDGAHSIVVDHCDIENVNKGIYARSSFMPINEVAIINCEMYDGSCGIKMTKSESNITWSDIVNFERGIQLLDSCDIYVSMTNFDGEDTYYYPKIAIEHVIGYGTECIVRNCCFRHHEDSYILSGDCSSINLGNGADSSQYGRNNLYSWAGYGLLPSYFIVVNDYIPSNPMWCGSACTFKAEGNYWGLESGSDPLSSYMCGTVDYTPYLGSATRDCSEQSGGISKSAGYSDGSTESDPIPNKFELGQNYPKSSCQELCKFNIQAACLSV